MVVFIIVVVVLLILAGAVIAQLPAVFPGISSRTVSLLQLLSLIVAVLVILQRLGYV